MNINFDISKCFSAMSVDIRIEILHLLANKPMGGNELLNTLNIPQPTLSYHMKKLQSAHLVKCSKKATNCFYSINKPIFQQIIANLSIIYNKD